MGTADQPQMATQQDKRYAVPVQGWGTKYVHKHEHENEANDTPLALYGCLHVVIAALYVPLWRCFASDEDPRSIYALVTNNTFGSESQ